MKSKNAFFAWVAIGGVAALGSLFAIKYERLDASQRRPRHENVAPRINPSTPHESAQKGMVFIPGGVFAMGCGPCSLPDALPVHMVEISPFWLDETPVTNSAFQRFVNLTGYETIAERQPDPRDYPTVPVEDLVPGSGVFSPPRVLQSLANALSWWRYVPGASWLHPEGVESDIAARLEHPVVHIAYPDALAYCKWANKRLPTEAEFEFAARGGLHGKLYAWGDELRPGGNWQANIFQGTFPVRNSASDGYSGTSPVKSFPPNGYGLYDVGGNVWQWTSDWYRADTYDTNSQLALVKDPTGPEAGFDPAEPDLPKRVQRGGSYLCSDQYCSRFLVGSRGKQEPLSAGSNVGFRCAKNAIVQADEIAIE